MKPKHKNTQKMPSFNTMFLTKFSILSERFHSSFFHEPLLSLICSSIAGPHARAGKGRSTCQSPRVKAGRSRLVQGGWPALLDRQGCGQAGPDVSVGGKASTGKSGLPCANRQPFPLNRYFKPDPPLANETRDRIFREYLEDPGKNTPRTLAVSYGLSIARINAILRLKSLERKLVMGGKPVQTDLAAKMDTLLLSRELTPFHEIGEQSLGSDSSSPKRSAPSPIEPLRPLETSRQTSFFAMVNETGIIHAFPSFLQHFKHSR